MTIEDIAGKARRVIVAQLGLGAVAATVAGVLAGVWQAGSLALGVLVGVALTLLLSRSVRRASEVAETDPKRSMQMLYVGAVQRFVFVIVALAAGMTVPGLAPFYVALGFVVALAAQLVNARGPQAR